MTDEPALPDGADENMGFPTAEDMIFDPKIAPSQFATAWDRDHDWYHYVNGYKDAADFLVLHLGELGRGAYKLGPPIIFLYRHHIELSIKWLIIECANLLGREKGFARIHQLDQIWRHCLSLLVEVSPGSVTTEEVQETTRLIDEFQRVDPQSMAFRYPEGKGDPPHPPLIRLGQIDPNRVCEVVGKISLLLECIRMELSTLKHDTL